jgi:tetratricopeptide (TPR) repeat protein
VLLVGSLEPHTLDYAQLAARMQRPRVAESLRTVRAEHPEALLSLFLFGTREVEQLTADISWVHRDDVPEVEFRAPKALYADSMFPMNYAGLERFRTIPTAVVPDYDPARRDAAAYTATALLWNVRDEPQRVLQALEQAQAREPDAVDTQIRLAEAAAQAGRWLEAEAVLERALERHPTHLTVLRLLARLRFTQGQLGEAADTYERVAHLTVPDGPLAEEIGNGFRAAGRAALAAEYYRSAIAQGGGAWPGIVLAYARTLMKLQARGPAEEVLRFGWTTFPQEAAFPLLFGEVLSEQERWADAATLFARALELAPASADAYYGLGRAAFSVGSPEEAVRYLHRGLQHEPYHRDALQLLHRIQHPDNI